MESRVRVLGIGATNERGLEVGVFVENGTIRVGDCVTAATTPNGERLSLRLDVLEIRFFDRRVDSLDEVFSGNLLLGGAVAEQLAPDSVLESVARSEPPEH